MTKVSATENDEAYSPGGRPITTKGCNNVSRKTSGCHGRAATDPSCLFTEQRCPHGH